MAMTLCNMAIEAGGKNAVIEADDTTYDYLKGRTDKKGTVHHSDADAKYCFNKTYKADELEPVVAQPHSPDNRALARECKNVKLDRSYIGSCTGGKITDFIAAAEILNGEKVKIDTFIVPATKDVENDLHTETIDGKSLAQIFEEAGAQIGEASCAACLGGPKDTFGRTQGTEVVISTTNRPAPYISSNASRIPRASTDTVRFRSGR